MERTIRSQIWLSHVVRRTDLQLLVELLSVALSLLDDGINVLVRDRARLNDAGAQSLSCTWRSMQLHVAATKQRVAYQRTRPSAC